MSTSIPDTETLSKLSHLEVFDASGNKVRFGSLFENQTVIVVFIRHFFCGLYVSQLSSEYSKLSQVFEEANVDIIAIGCGDWQPIEKYSDITGFPFSKIFADPSLGVFHGLGMDIKTLARTPTGEKRASYLTEGIIKGSLWSIWRGLKNPRLIGKQGNIAQLGGEFILGPGNRCTFAHRMRHTEDREWPFAMEKKFPTEVYSSWCIDTEISELLEGANLRSSLITTS
ncbi:AhpC/TSA antioxidant enzyme-domain-containing protein [Lentinula lateritia]|uniref:AhpC/TSA antioxidant enzyme-domain-containing protein n=1 Tax=Lentinula lateritia TaxID=40482 RepID=A0ABQ8V6Z0_9AGAR|nr:AhpC/TSA antioxidant enzyme-domain-containing protein [Lentinula lateritia]